MGQELSATTWKLLPLASLPQLLCHTQETFPCVFHMARLRYTSSAPDHTWQYSTSNPPVFHTIWWRHEGHFSLFHAFAVVNHRATATDVRAFLEKLSRSVPVEVAATLHLESSSLDSRITLRRTRHQFHLILRFSYNQDDSESPHHPASAAPN